MRTEHFSVLNQCEGQRGPPRLQPGSNYYCFTAGVEIHSHLTQSLEGFITRD